MLKNAYFLAKIDADTAQNEQHFAEILPILPRTRELRHFVPHLTHERRGLPPVLVQRRALVRVEPADQVTSNLAVD